MTPRPVPKADGHAARVVNEVSGSKQGVITAIKHSHNEYLAIGGNSPSAIPWMSVWGARDSAS